MSRRRMMIVSGRGETEEREERVSERVSEIVTE